MNGKSVVRQVQSPEYEFVLDYTSIASPLVEDGVVADIREWQATSYDSKAPAKIVMWEHQRDWLLKCWQRAATHTIGTYSWTPAEENTSLRPAAVDFILGIPVEIAQ